MPGHAVGTEENTGNLLEHLEPNVQRGRFRNYSRWSHEYDVEVRGPFEQQFVFPYSSPQAGCYGGDPGPEVKVERGFTSGGELAVAFEPVFKMTGHPLDLG